MLLLQLFFSFIQVGLFSVGGGYAAIPLIQNQIVDIHGLMINSATFVGMRLAGIPGVILCTFGCILPAFVICSLLAYFYYKYRKLGAVQTILASLRPAVVALIASAGLSILLLALFQADKYNLQINDFHIVEAVLFVGALFILRKYKASAITIIFGTGVVGTLAYLVIPGLS